MSKIFIVLALLFPVAANADQAVSGASTSEPQQPRPVQNNYPQPSYIENGRPVYVPLANNKSKNLSGETSTYTKEKTTTDSNSHKLPNDDTITHRDND